MRDSAPLKDIVLRFTLALHAAGIFSPKTMIFSLSDAHRTKKHHDTLPCKEETLQSEQEHLPVDWHLCPICGFCDQAIACWKHESLIAMIPLQDTDRVDRWRELERHTKMTFDLPMALYILHREDAENKRIAAYPYVPHATDAHKRLILANYLYQTERIN